MIDKILDECKNQDIANIDAIKYILATVEHETNGTFKPVKEAYWLSENWRKKNLRYYPYYGRGLVQITWRHNYLKFSKILTEMYGCNYINLSKNPDLVLNEEFSIKILVYGMKHGVFTGKKLGDYFNDEKSNFIGARKIINGKDRAEHIAMLAHGFDINLS